MGRRRGHGLEAVDLEPEPGALDLDAAQAVSRHQLDQLLHLLECQQGIFLLVRLRHLWPQGTPLRHDVAIEAYSKHPSDLPRSPPLPFPPSRGKGTPPPSPSFEVTPSDQVPLQRQPGPPQLEARAAL